MINIYFKRIWRNKWLMVKMFLISPIISILPIIMINGYTDDISEDRVLCMCIWSFIYFCIFENVNMKMKDNNVGKTYDILLAKKTIFSINLCEKIALILSFLPSFFLTYVCYFLIFNFDFNIKMLIILFVSMIIFEFVFIDFTLVLNLRFKNYFNKFNVCMSVIYFLAGILYSIDNLPRIIQYFSYMVPISFLFKYIYSKNIADYFIFLISLCTWFCLIKTFLNMAVKRFRRLGGTI